MRQRVAHRDQQHTLHAQNTPDGENKVRHGLDKLCAAKCVVFEPSLGLEQRLNGNCWNAWAIMSGNWGGAAWAESGWTVHGSHITHSTASHTLLLPLQGRALPVSKGPHCRSSTYAACDAVRQIRHSKRGPGSYMHPCFSHPASKVVPTNTPPRHAAPPEPTECTGFTYIPILAPTHQKLMA